MFEMFDKIKDCISVVRTSYLPKAKRIWKGYGYYISLAFLLTLFGVSAYLYRSNRPIANEIAIQPVENPASVMAMAPFETPETIPTPAPTPWLPVFIEPVSNGICGEYTADELIWNETLGYWSVHNGIDITASAGTAVIASETGTVSAIYEDDLYGNIVEIIHEDGWVTRYCSLESITIAETGTKVQKGDIIGSVGNTALCETGLGAHLHFETLHNGIQTEPCFY